MPHPKTLLAPAAVLLALAGGLAFWTVAQPPVQAQETRVPQSQAEISLGFAPVVKEATPAVVNIYAKRIVAQKSPFADDPFFSEFFRSFGQGQPRVQNSLGSGVILSADGYVVTNYHVVGQADEIRVVLNNRREFNAEVLMADEEADLAILKLDGAEDMPHIDLRDSDTVEVGELALAIGNPFGVGQTVSSGIVSGLARSGTAVGNARGYFIQTDAPINPGNSGGALIDVNGDLIGVNTSILSRSGGSNGIGFAIPAALVKQFLSQAEAGETSFRRPWAGMTGHAVDADMAHAMEMDLPTGIVIDDLQEGSPFSEDFRPGDVILAVDGRPVAGPAEMLYRMTVAGLGGEARVTRLRDGDRTDVTVPMVAAPEEPARDPVVTAETSVLPGVTFITLNPAVISDYNLPFGATGVMIEEPGPVATRAGLRKGDLIAAINGQEVTTSREASAALDDPGRWLELVVIRDGQRRVMRFRL